MSYGKETCPHCGLEIGVRAFPRHVELCSRLPDNETIIEMARSGKNTTHMSEKFGIHKSTLTGYLRNRGIYLSEIQRQESVLIAAPEDDLAPLYGLKNSGNGSICDEHCPGWENCRMRQRRGLWPLCCRPAKIEVALAYRDGLIGFDHNMPEWLPELVDEVRIR